MKWEQQQNSFDEGGELFPRRHAKMVLKSEFWNIRGCWFTSSRPVKYVMLKIFVVLQSLKILFNLHCQNILNVPLIDERIISQQQWIFKVLITPSNGSKQRQKNISQLFSARVILSLLCCNEAKQKNHQSSSFAITKTVKDDINAIHSCQVSLHHVLYRMSLLEGLYNKSWKMVSHLKILLGCFSTCSRVESHKTHRLENESPMNAFCTWQLHFCEKLVFEYLRMTFCHFYWWLWAGIPHNPGKLMKRNVECKWAVGEKLYCNNVSIRRSCVFCVSFHEKVMGGGLLSSRMDEHHTATARVASK